MEEVADVAVNNQEMFMYIIKPVDAEIHVEIHVVDAVIHGEVAEIHVAVEIHVDVVIHVLDMEIRADAVIHAVVGATLAV